MSFADSSFASTPFSSELEDNTTVVLTGIQLTIAQNNVNLSTDNNITVTAPADQMDFSIGSIIAEAESIVDTVTGVQIDTSLGDAVVNASVSFNVTGLDAPADVGTVTAFADVEISLTGLQINFSDGDATVTGNADVSLTGIELASSLGNIVVESAYSFTGVSMQFADGTPTVLANAIVEVTGVEMSAFVGNMRSTPWANVVTGASNTWTEVAA
jgi:hypothetical protein